MGTVVTVAIWTGDEKNAVKGANLVFAEFDRIDEKMNSWRAGSDVFALNQGKSVSGETCQLIATAEKWRKKTSGAFDISVGGFRGIWKFDQDKDGTLPTKKQVQVGLRKVGGKRVSLRQKKGKCNVRPLKKSQFTLGGIAKGYAVDRAVKILHDAGYVDFLLQAGGDLYASGRKGNRKWRVGIRDPRGSVHSVFAFAEVQDRTFSTSGDYERFVVMDGRRYHHILNPKTGYPANKNRSVTVVAKSALLADILSTSLFVMGPKKGLELVESLGEVEAVFVGADNQVVISSGLQGTLNVVRKPSDGI